MNIVKVKENFIRSKPYKLRNTNIYLPTLDEIYDLGVSNYFEMLYVVIIDLSKVELLAEVMNEASDFNLFLFLLSQDQKLFNLFFEALTLFTKDRFILREDGSICSVKARDEEGNIFFATERLDPSLEYFVGEVLDEEFWSDFREILLIAHWIAPYDKRENISAEAKKIMEKLEKNKKVVSDIKNKNGEKRIEIYDIIASLAANSPSYNILNIWELNYFQLFDQFKRAQIREEYEFNLQQILAGADDKKLNTQHWVCSIAP